MPSELSVIEKIVLNFFTPISAMYWTFRRGDNYLDNLKKHWEIKRRRYEYLVEKMENEECLDRIASKYMTVFCYKCMIKIALKKTKKEDKYDFNKWATQHPLRLIKRFR